MPAFVTPAASIRDFGKRRRKESCSDLLSSLAEGKGEGSDVAPTGNGSKHEGRTTRHNLTILIPSFNERNRIGYTLSSYIECLRQTPCKHGGIATIIVVDDGSTDGTAEYIREKMWRDSPRKEREANVGCWEVNENVSCISLPENVGKGAAIGRGMEEVSQSDRSVVLVADADGSGDIACIRNMLQTLDELISSSAIETSILESADQPPALVVGHRKYRELKSPLRSLLSWGFRTCVRAIFLGADLGVRDTQCGFKLMTASAGTLLYRELNLQRWTHDVEVLHRARLLGIPIGETAVPWVDKEGSKLITSKSSAVVVSSIMLGEIALMRILYLLGIWKGPC